MNFLRIIGWFLFSIGLILIFWSLYSSYNIFTGRSLAPEVFEIKNKETENQVSLKGKTPTSLTEIQKEMEKMINEQIKEIIPLDFLPKILNLIVWTIFAGILIFAGGQISNLGIKLIKK